MDYSPPGSSVHGIFQARILEWGAISFSRWFTILFGGGIGPAIMDALSVEDMSPEELVRAERVWGIDIRRFES